MASPVMCFMASEGSFVSGIDKGKRIKWER
jgi:hypothetical protein